MLANLIEPLILLLWLRISLCDCRLLLREKSILGKPLLLQLEVCKLA